MENRWAISVFDVIFCMMAVRSVGDRNTVDEPGSTVPIAAVTVDRATFESSIRGDVSRLTTGEVWKVFSTVYCHRSSIHVDAIVCSGSSARLTVVCSTVVLVHGHEC